MPPNGEKTLKCVDALFEALAEEQNKQPGLDRIEHVYQRAVALVQAHPINRVIAVTRPRAALQEVANG